MDDHQLRRSHGCRRLQSEAKQPFRDESGALLRLVHSDSLVGIGRDACFSARGARRKCSARFRSGGGRTVETR
jgi:hypothetical protein